MRNGVEQRSRRGGKCTRTRTRTPLAQHTLAAFLSSGLWEDGRAQSVASKSFIFVF